MKALTPIQETVLAYLRTYLAENDCLPSTRQIAKHFGWASQTNAMQHLRHLVKKGHLETVTDATRRTFYRFARPLVGTHPIPQSGMPPSDSSSQDPA